MNKMNAYQASLVSQKVTIFGVGYVGLVQAVIFAEWGHDVLAVDIDAEKIKQLQQGVVPFFEPGLAGRLMHQQRTGRLRFSAELGSGVHHGYFLFISVGTPSGAQGFADLSQVYAVAEVIGMHRKEPMVVVNRSTVPVGTAEQVQQIILACFERRGHPLPVEVVSNPEFLREGHAMQDAALPERVVIGRSNPAVEKDFYRLYAPLVRERLIFMSTRSAELTKYAANAFLATKISFVNEISAISAACGSDIAEIQRGIGLDSRIGFAFLQPGCGYGGSCFPKDIRALISSAQRLSIDPILLKAVHAVNEQQKHLLYRWAVTHYRSLSGRLFAIWGITFKPNTDDTREAPSWSLIDDLLRAGAILQIYDPQGRAAVEARYSKESNVRFTAGAESALCNAEGLFLVTEWPLFAEIPVASIRAKLGASGVIFDGRNLFSPEAVKRSGLGYYSLGRPAFRFRQDL